jgi:serine protease Do
MRTLYRLWGATTRVGLAAGLAAFGLASAAPAQDMSFSQAQLVRGLLPSVVNITARAEVAETPEPVMASASSAGTTGKASSSNALYSVKVSAGSGFIIDGSGEIATNWHVVVGAYEMIVTFSDGSRAKAELVNASPLVDLALLRVDVGKKLPAVQWADSAKVQVGDPVLAIGNPLGIGMSVSGGIVSAVNRNIMDTPYDDFIQTDAAINHGNSGGPLFNMKGEVIGVNSAIISSAIISPTSGNAGLGFSMPANDARFIFDRLGKHVLKRPGYLGVKLQQVSPEMALALGMTEPQGSIIAAVTNDGPSAHAGLRPGDVVLRYAGETQSDERALLRAIARTAPGTTVEVGVRRGGQDLALPVKVEEWPTMWWEDVHGGTPGGQPHLNIPADLGLTVEPLDDKMRASYGVMQGTQGVIVTGVLPGTDAAQRGLGLGDVIEQVDDAPVSSAAAVQQEIERARSENRPFALFLVMRKNQAVTAAQLPGPKWYALRVSAG